ncbi:MAG: PhzF family phenazine biosynthesis protein [Ferruginibacter sp.]|nr:PhzF family phenazine biosynthesis protein [Ferruginibacter sp.]
MPEYTIYQADAFTNKLFGGNPAAVIPLEKWLDDVLMQQIAAENNLAETVFFVPKGGGYHIRWFTPELEIDLCGHATLASAFILYEYLGYTKSQLLFYSKSGELVITRHGDKFQLNFPSRMPVRVSDYPAELLKGLGITDPLGVYKSRDYVVELATEKDVLNISIDVSLLNQIDTIGIIVTAPGNNCDFVSRFFAPNCGIPEDPVTGSAHSTLIPFWAEKLNKDTLHAKQLSKRGGELWCENLGNRVTMSGNCVFYMKGEIRV